MKSETPFTIESSARAQRYGVLLAATGAAAFSLKPVFIKLVFSHGIDTETIMMLRMSFALPIYLVIGWHALRAPAARCALDRGLVLRSMAVGVLGYYLAAFLDVQGLQFISAQFERMILFLYPTFVCALGWLFFAQPISPRLLVSLPLCYGGIAFIFMHDFATLGANAVFGGALVTASALCFAGYMLFSKTCIDRLGSAAFTCIAMVAASIVILIHFLLTHELTALLVPWQVLSLCFTIAIISTVLPSFMISEAIARLGSSKTSIVACIGPVVTAATAVALLGEAFTLYHLAGTTLVLGGVVYLWRERTAARSTE